jgi:hypothetical protein
MNHKAMFLSLAIVGVSACALFAEQEVTLKSGATLVGDVSFDGDAVVVQIGDAKQRVPLASVASITPVDFGQDRQANRLLLRALETRLMGGTAKEAVGLLAEASRLAPDDPQIAFWYASTLVDAGSGKAAKRVLDAHRDKIDEAMPDAADDLASRINVRMVLELLPAELVARIDKLNAAAALQPVETQMRQVYAAFRVLDQFNDPIEQSAFQIQANGNDERLEEFGDGYFLFTCSQHRNSDNDPSRLVVAASGLKPETHELRTASDRVYLAGEFVVHRFGEEDKRAIDVAVVDRDGKPVAGARLELQSQNQRNNRADNAISAATDDAGRASMPAFPGPYVLTANADDYNNAMDQFELTTDVPTGVQRRLTLHRALRANVRMEWISKPVQGFPGAPGGGGTTSGDATMPINGPRGAAPYNQELQWLRPSQVDNRISLQMNLMMFGQMAGMGAPWVKVRAVGEEGEEAGRLAEAAKAFKELDLKELDDSPEGFKPVVAAGGGRNRPNFGPGSLQATANFGDVFVGKLTGRDTRTGQPAEVTFKAIVERPEEDAAETP